MTDRNVLHNSQLEKPMGPRHAAETELVGNTAMLPSCKDNSPSADSCMQCEADIKSNLSYLENLEVTFQCPAWEI